MQYLYNRNLLGIKLYVWLITISLILHVFNEISIDEIKLFQIPAATAFIIPIIFAYKLGKLQIFSYLLIAVTYLSALLSPYPQSLSKALSFMVILGSCAAIPKCDYVYIVKLVNRLIPIPLFFLVLGLTTNEGYRYTGMYNDPNYLCTTLLVFLFIILQGFYIFKNKIIRGGLTCEIILIMALTASTLSRTGLACILIMIIISVWEFIRKYKSIAIVLLVTSMAYLYFDTPPQITQAIENIETREENQGKFSSASNLRYEISMGGIRYVFSNPIELPFGMGIGSVGHWEYFGYGSNDIHIDHNTLTASFSEQGLLGFILFVSILYTTFKTNWQLPKKDKFKLLRLSAFFSIFIFSLSINQMTYLPFWWLIFLLNNTTSLHEDSSYRRLRSFRKH